MGPEEPRDDSDIDRSKIVERFESANTEEEAQRLLDQVLADGGRRRPRTRIAAATIQAIAASKNDAESSAEVGARWAVICSAHRGAPTVEVNLRTGRAASPKADPCTRQRLRRGRIAVREALSSLPEWRGDRGMTEVDEWLRLAAEEDELAFGAAFCPADAVVGPERPHPLVRLTLAWHAMTCARCMFRRNVELTFRDPSRAEPRATLVGRIWDRVVARRALGASTADDADPPSCGTDRILATYLRETASITRKSDFERYAVVDDVFRCSALALIGQAEASKDESCRMRLADSLLTAVETLVPPPDSAPGRPDVARLVTRLRRRTGAEFLAPRLRHLLPLPAAFEQEAVRRLRAVDPGRDADVRPLRRLTASLAR